MERAAFIGPRAWTFPASIILAALTVWAWLMFALISRTSPPACELLDRTAWLAAASAATAACLLPIALIERLALRLAASLASAAIAGYALWSITAQLFPRFC
jgi:hypothetical protein